MKAFLIVFAFGISLKASQLKASAVDAEKASYKPCCHSETLEGSATALYPPGYSTIYSKFYLDYKNRMYADLGYVAHTTVKTILLCDLDDMCSVYTIIESDKSCSKFQLHNAIDQIWIRCIPSNATSEGTMRIGSDERQGNSLLLRNWMFTNYGTKYQRSVTDADCIPVVDFQIMGGPSPNLSLFAQVYYFDITKEIKDPSVFKPPSYCDKANDVHEDSKFQRQNGNNLFSALR